MAKTALQLSSSSVVRVLSNDRQGSRRRLSLYAGFVLGAALWIVLSYGQSTLAPVVGPLIGPPMIDTNGVMHFQVTSGFQGQKPTIVRVLEPTHPPLGAPHRFLYVMPVEAGINLDSVYSDGLEELRRLDVHNRYNLTLIAPSFHIEPWYGDHVRDVERRLESFIVNHLVPFADGFATPGATPPRWVLGFSKSGFGALSLLFRNPHVFSAAAASGEGHAGWRCEGS